MPKTINTRSALVRGLSVALFIAFMIASGHLSMKAINWVDESVSGETYAKIGVEGRYFGDMPLAEKLKSKSASKSIPEEQKNIYLNSSEAVQAGKTFQFYMLPVSPFLVVAALAMVALGVVLLFWTRRVKNDAIQSILGVFAGSFIWTGGVEYGLIIASRKLGIAKSFTFVHGHLVGSYGEYVLLKHTWGFLMIIGAYLLFMESSRCPFFMWFRDRLPIMRGARAAGPIHNYGPRTAFQYTTVTWTFYVLLLWAYDGSIFGVHGWLTHAIFFGSLACGIYLLMKLVRFRTTGPALRYAIGTVVVFWNMAEIAAKWGLFTEPWLILQPASFVTFFGGLAIGTYWIIQEFRRPALSHS